MGYSLQSTFLGDVIYYEDATIGLSVTVTGPTLYDWSATILAGSVFASPLSLVQYILQEWNGEHTGQATARIIADPDDADYGKIAITPDAGFGTISAFVLNVGDATIGGEVGLSGASQDFGAVGSAEFVLDSPVTYIYTPHWPLTAYRRGVEVTSGYADYAHDGTTYALAGHHRATLEIGVAVDRTDWTEYAAWRLLWNARWGAGRGCAFYLDREADLPASYSAEDYLVINEEMTTFRSRRLIDWKEYIDNQDAIVFGVASATASQSL